MNNNYNNISRLRTLDCLLNYSPQIKKNKILNTSSEITNKFRVFTFSDK